MQKEFYSYRIKSYINETIKKGKDLSFDFIHSQLQFPNSPSSKTKYTGRNIYSGMFGLLSLVNKQVLEEECRLP